MGSAWDGHGEMTTFNVHDGLEEAMIRGYRSGFLTDVSMINCWIINHLRRTRTH